MNGFYRAGFWACRQIGLAAMVAFWLAMVPVRAADAPAQTGPAAVLAQPEHHFGTVVEGETVTHEFVLQNKGGAVLAIENLKSG